MVPRAGLEPARIAPHAPQTCAATNYATSAKLSKTYFFSSVALVSAGGATGATVGDPAGVAVGEATGAFAGASSAVVSRTEDVPEIAGMASRSAETMKTDAATIVIFESIVAVPRGANALLETLLVNKAPALVFPGCSRTAETNTMHEMKNIM